MHNLIDYPNIVRVACTQCLQSWPIDNVFMSRPTGIDPNHFECNGSVYACWSDPSRGHDWERNQSFAECADCDAHVAGV